MSGNRFYALAVIGVLYMLPDKPEAGDDSRFGGVNVMRYPEGRTIFIFFLCPAAFGTKCFYPGRGF
ncbi:hypothetical protein IMF27_14980 [Pseudomonas sp. PCH199]|uniref:hypothetical protein n=1 Tax=unclassified Pseudomonas TaxID=196821 RepID=UPI000FFC71ED|nr:MULTISPECIES: hypothetical protein [unclassified Pseudomonas]MCW8276814.1 hypothetical protein [Pseudomonas sp. PCH199]